MKSPQVVREKSGARPLKQEDVKMINRRVHQEKEDSKAKRKKKKHKIPKSPKAPDKEPKIESEAAPKDSDYNEFVPEVWPFKIIDSQHPDSRIKNDGARKGKRGGTSSASSSSGNISGQLSAASLKIRSLVSTRYKKRLDKIELPKTAFPEFDRPDEKPEKQGMVGPTARGWSASLITYGRDFASMEIRHRLLRRVFLLLLLEHCVVGLVVVVFLCVKSLREIAMEYWFAFLISIVVNVILWVCILQHSPKRNQDLRQQLVTIAAFQLGAMIYGICITGINGLMLRHVYPMEVKDLFIYNGIYLLSFGLVYLTIVVGSLQVKYPMKSARYMNYFFMGAFFTSNIICAIVVEIYGTHEKLEFSPMFVALLILETSYIGFRILVLRFSSYFLISENRACPVDPAQFVKARIVIVDEYYYKPPAKFPRWLLCSKTRRSKKSFPEAERDSIASANTSTTSTTITTSTPATKPVHNLTHE